MRPIVAIRPLKAPPTADPLPVAGLRLRRSLAWPVGQAEAWLSPAVEAPAPATALRIEGAGQGGQLRPLFTGQVLRRQSGLWGSRILIEETTGPLARLHADKALASATAAKAIQDLCSEAGVAVRVEPPGAQLPSYALRAESSAMEQILHLARLSGLLVATDGEGRLQVATALPTPAATLRREDSVIEFQADEPAEEPPALRVTGDGALGGSGPGAESWLLQSLDGLRHGEGERALHWPALKTTADLTRAATALTSRRAESGRRLRLVLAGIPPVDLGQVVLLTGFGPSPQPARLAAVALRWDVATGLISRLELHAIGG